METSSRELRLLTNALRQPTFRFIVIGHNRKHIISDVAEHIRATYPERPFLNLRLKGKTYREIIDTLNAFREGIVVVPDFDWLFRLDNEDLCTAFNQRRDALARLSIALLCFVEPSGYTNVPKRIPDWWSLRSLALEFESNEADTTDELLQLNTDASSLGGQTKAEKEAEIERLLQQLYLADLDNIPLLLSLNNQLGIIYCELSQFSEALPYFNQNLKLAQKIGSQEGEGTTLNNISQVYHAWGDYEKALEYLEQSIQIKQQIGNREGEGATLNNIGQIYQVWGDYKKALQYLEQSLSLSQHLNNREGESRALNNIGQIYRDSGDYDRALQYFERSLMISQQIGNQNGEGVTLNNISQIYDARGDYEKALQYLEQSLMISQQIGDRSGEGLTLNNISQIYRVWGDYETALQYLKQSLEIRQQIGDREGESITLNNIGAIHFEQYHDIETAASYFLQAYSLLSQIGSPNAGYPESYFSDVIEQVGKERFKAIAESVGFSVDAEKEVVESDSAIKADQDLPLLDDVN